MEIFNKIRGAVNVRDFFERYLIKQYKGEVTIDKFKSMPEVLQIGIVYHFITKAKICLVIMPQHHYAIIEVDKENIADLISMEKMDIVIQTPTSHYILKDKEYEGSYFIGLKSVILETISFLDSTQWLNLHPGSLKI